MSAASDHAARAACEAAARAALARVADAPEARYARRVAFYRRWGAGNPLLPAGYGGAELAFTRWEIDRGLLNPLDHPTRPGSPYWRATNAAIALDAELAAALFARRLRPEDPARDAWCAFFARPSAERWYRAHTLSLVRAMAAHAAEGAAEPDDERRFINAALYRLLDAEVMARGGVLGGLGRALADPRLPGVRAVVGRPWLYPREYPARGPASGVIVRAGERALRSVVARRAVVDEVVREYLPTLADEHPTALRRRFARGAPVYPSKVFQGEAT